MKHRYLCAALALLLIIFSFTTLVSAQTITPKAAGETVRQQLFEAQSALMSGDAATSASLVIQANSTYQEILRTPILQAESALVETVDHAFAQAQQSAEQGDGLGLAVARARIWTGLLNGSTRVVLC
jgi:hypothetical protein